MNKKEDISRIIIELPKEEHRKLKSRAAFQGKTMREMVLESLAVTDACAYSSHKPNAQTKKSLKNIEEGKNLTEISLDDFIKKLGL